MAAVTAAVFYSAWTLVVLGLVAGLSGQLANLSLDALVQSDIGESVRTSVFAWAETLLQIAWVLGGGLGIALPLIPQLGFGHRRAARRPVPDGDPQSHRAPSAPGHGGPAITGMT